VWPIFKEEHSVSLKSKLLAGSATLALVAGGAVVATSGVAHAATPSCGKSCVDVFNDQFGDGQTGHPAFLMDSYKQGIATGTPIILFRESNSDPAEDFVFEDQGTVSDFYAAGLVGAATALHYGCIPGVNFPVCGAANAFDLEAYEVEYAPFGAATGQCVGVAATATAGEKVTLQPCGVSSKTVWIVDLVDGQLGDNTMNGFSNLGGVFAPVPLINGSNSNFSHPFVLTYPGSGYPTDQPRPVLYTANLTGFFTGVFPTNTFLQSDVNSNQLWDADFGTVQL